MVVDDSALMRKLLSEALRRDPKAIERLARESLGYGKPGETVIRFEAPSTNAPRF
jgi:cell division protein FtsB